MSVSRVSVLLALCCRGTAQILSADDLDHVSLLQTHVHRRITKDGLDDPNLNVLQHQLDKLQRKVATLSHVHQAEKERKSIMMVDLQSPLPDEEIKDHQAKADGSKKKKRAEEKPTKLDKFAKASLAKADKAEEMERSAMASMMDDEAGELADDESHVLSAGALDRLEEVAERVAQSKGEDEGLQDFKFDEEHDDKRQDHHKSKKGDDKDKQEKDDDKESGGDDAVDPEAELVRLAHQRTQREEAKAQLAESAAKDAWLELEKFQAQRNVDDFPAKAPIAPSAPQASPNKTSVPSHKKWQGR